MPAGKGTYGSTRGRPPKKPSGHGKRTPPVPAQGRKPKSPKTVTPEPRKPGEMYARKQLRKPGASRRS